MEILLISGISGAGKSVALRVLEDANYYCVDNLPPGCCRNWWKPWSRIISCLLRLRLIPAASADCISAANHTDAEERRAPCQGSVF
jgi:hypothetical protein